MANKTDCPKCKHAKELAQAYQRQKKSWQKVGTNPDWLGFSHEGYVFAAAVFWIFCFGMSRYSQNLEKKLDTGQ